MAKQVNLFSINVVGIDDVINNLSLMQSELKAVNSLIDKNNKTIKEYESITKSGASATAKQTDAYIDAKQAMPGLVADKKRLTDETLKFQRAVDKEVLIQKQAVSETEKSRKVSEAAAKKQSQAEKKLQSDLSLQVRSIEDLSAKTNALIAVRKKLDLTTEDGRREFEALTKEIVKNLDQLKQYDAQIGNYQRNVGNYSSAVSGMFNAWNKGAVLIAAAGKAIEYTIDVIGDKTEGVEIAFARLNNPGILDQLRAATKGTVSDLNLMTAAVKADNFKIPLDTLAKGLQFAQQRAKDTGESVDYLVNSFVTGIGRKSTMILDNLGISAVAVREKLGGIGTESASVGQMAEAVSAIIEEEMSKIEDSTDLAADSAGQLRTEFENVQNQAKKGIANFLRPIAVWAKDGLQWVSRNADAIITLVKAMGVLTVAIYTYIVAGKLKLLLSKETRVAIGLETIATYRQAAASKQAMAATHLLAAAKLLLTGNVRAATVAFRAFTVALMSNPIGIVLGLIAALAGAMYLFAGRTSEAEKISKNFYETLARERAEVDNLFESLKKTNEGTDERKKLINEINEKYKEYLPKLLTEKSSLNEIETAQLAVNEALRGNLALKLKEEARVDTMTKHIAKQTKYLNNLRERAVKTVGEEAATNMINDIQTVFNNNKDNFLKARSEARKILEENKLIDNNSRRNRAIGDLALFTASMERASKELNSIDKQYESFITKPKPKNEPEKTISNISDEINSANDEVTRLKNEIDDLRSGKTTVNPGVLVQDVIGEKIKEFEAAKKTLETLTGKTEKPTGGEKDNTADQRAKLIEENNKYIVSLIRANEDMELKVMADGIEKKLAQQKIGYERELKAASDARTEQKNKLQAAGVSAFDPQSLQVDAEYQKQKTNIEAVGEQERLNLLKSYTVAQLSEYQTRLDNQTEIGRKEIALVNNIIKEKRKEQDDDIYNSTQTQIDEITRKYDFEREMIRNTITDAEVLNARLLQLTIEEKQAKFDALKAELAARRALGVITEQEYKSTIARLKILFEEVQELTDEQDKDKKKVSPLAQMLGLDEDSITQIKDAAFQLASEIASTISNLQLESNRAWLSNETKRLDEIKNKEQSNLDKRKKNGILSEETYNRQREKLDKQHEAQKLEIERQAFEKEKDIKRKQALMEMALGIARIWSQAGVNFILGAALSAALVATTALQISQINAQQFAGGGKVLKSLPNGKVVYSPNIKTQPNGDNVLATVKTGEVILNKDQQKRLGGDKTFRAIGVPGFAGGGKVNIGQSWNSVPIPEDYTKSSAKKIAKRSMSDSELIDHIDKKMDAKIAAIKVYVSETDIQETGNTKKVTVNQSELL